MPTKTTQYCALLTCLLCVFSGESIFGQVADTGVKQSLGLGAYYANGDYGDSNSTEILYVPVSYEANFGRWGFQLVMPWLEVRGRGNVLVNIGGITRAVAGTQRAKSSGIGDVIASAIYQFDPVSESAPFIDLRLDVKLPTADEGRSLGTGETDVSIQIDLSQNVSTSVIFATIGRNHRGKTSLYPGLKDSSFAQVGFARPFSENWNGGIFFDYREAASSFSDDSRELVPYLSWQLSEKWSFTALVTRGFTDASADYSVMGQIIYRW